MTRGAPSGDGVRNLHFADALGNRRFQTPAHSFAVGLSGGAVGGGQPRHFEPGMIFEHLDETLTDDSGCAKNSDGYFMPAAWGVKLKVIPRSYCDSGALRQRGISAGVNHRMKSGRDLSGYLQDGFATGLHYQLRGSVTRQAPRVQRAEGVRVSGERPVVIVAVMAADPATLQQLLNGSIQKGDLRAVAQQQFGVFVLHEGPASQCDDGSGWKLFKNGAQGVGFDLAEARLAISGEKVGNAEALAAFDFLVEINKGPGKMGGQEAAYAGFASAHKPGKSDDARSAGGGAGLGMARHVSC